MKIFHDQSTVVQLHKQTKQENTVGNKIIPAAKADPLGTSKYKHKRGLD